MSKIPANLAAIADADLDAAIATLADKLATFRAFDRVAVALHAYDVNKSAEKIALDTIA